MVRVMAVLVYDLCPYSLFQGKYIQVVQVWNRLSLTYFIVSSTKYYQLLSYWKIVHSVSISGARWFSNETPVNFSPLCSSHHSISRVEFEKPQFILEFPLDIETSKKVYTFILVEFLKHLFTRIISYIRWLCCFGEGLNQIFVSENSSTRSMEYSLFVRSCNLYPDPFKIREV